MAPVNPEHYFDKVGGRISKKPGAIYDIVLTTPLQLATFEVESVNHPNCISRKCSGCDANTSAEIVRRLAITRAGEAIGASCEIQQLLDHFPCLVGRKVVLVHPSE